jgi:hypothetical protein
MPKSFRVGEKLILIIMKKFILFNLFVVMAFFLTSCIGEDGKDGKVYVSFTWVGTIAYQDNIPETPTYITDDYDYLITPGKYTFSYTHLSIYPYNSYSKTYNFAADPGKKGSFMTDGEDGEDSYYEVGLWSSGPDVYDYSDLKSSSLKSSNSEKITPKEIIEKIKKEKGLLKNPNEQNMLIIK